MGTSLAWSKNWVVFSSICRSYGSKAVSPLSSDHVKWKSWAASDAGGPIIDPYGDAVMCCNKLPGDTWRTRHDTCKMAISRESVAAKLPHDVEVYGLFAHLLPAVATEQGGELQWARARQGLVPDFRFRLPTPQGPTDTLAELKVISAGSTWHPPSGSGGDRSGQEGWNSRLLLSPGAGQV